MGTIENYRRTNLDIEAQNYAIKSLLARDEV